jgi:hypothetical protein
MAKKTQKLEFSTTKGTFKFPRLGTPDTKFKPEGEYSVKFVTNREASAGLLAKLQPLHDSIAKRGKKLYAELPVASRKKLDAKGGFQINPLFNVVYNDAEEETGEIEFNFKMSASGEYKNGPRAGQKWSRKPAVFDAKLKPMDGSKVWGGTVGKVSFEVGTDKEGEAGYFIPGTGAAGLSLRLKGVQIVTLVSGSGGDAKSMGFEEEDGYEGDEEKPEAEEKETGEEAGEGEESDGSEDF